MNKMLIVSMFLAVNAAASANENEPTDVPRRAPRAVEQSQEEVIESAVRLAELRGEIEGRQLAAQKRGLRRAETLGDELSDYTTIAKKIVVQVGAQHATQKAIDKGASGSLRYCRDTVRWYFCPTEQQIEDDKNEKAKREAEEDMNRQVVKAEIIAYKVKAGEAEKLGYEEQKKLKKINKELEPIREKIKREEEYQTKGLSENRIKQAETDFKLDELCQKLAKEGLTRSDRELLEVLKKNIIEEKKKIDEIVRKEEQEKEAEEKRINEKKTAELKLEAEKAVKRKEQEKLARAQGEQNAAAVLASINKSFESKK